MAQFSRLTADQRSNLVAYLDGELDDQDTAVVERALAQSAVARNEIEALARTYDLLDELPRATVAKDFTERTMATARLETARTDVTQTVWYRAVRDGSKYGIWSLVMIGAGCLGYMATRAWTPNDNDVLVNDYEVVQRLDRYREIDNFEFVQQLSDQHPEVMQDIREGGR